MISQNQKILNWINVITDGMILFASYLIATFIRFYIMYGAKPALQIAWNQEYFTAAFVFTAIELLVFSFAHLYSLTRRNRLYTEIIRIISVGALAILGLMAFLYLTRVVDFSRIAMGIYLVLTTVLLSVKRIILRLILRYFRKEGYNQKHVLIVGDGKHAYQYIEGINQNPHLGFTIDGYASRVDKEGLGKRLGTYEDLDRILSERDIDEVVIALEMHEVSYMSTIIAACDKAGTRVSIIPYFNDYIPVHPTIYNIGESRMIDMRAIPLDNVLNAFLKRLLDIIGSLILIILTSPIMLIVAIGVKISTRSTVFFKQKRIGKDKKVFTMLKFRSMRENSSEQTGWSRDEDNRKTKFGSFIRKFSLDELPQFFNVLIGDMSIIGPRPEVPFYVDKFKEEIPLYLVRQQVRPGITGWAQVNGLRGDTSIEERIKYDIWYIENWTMGLDLLIILKTIFGGMMNSEKIVK